MLEGVCVRPYIRPSMRQSIHPSHKPQVGVQGPLGMLGSGAAAGGGVPGGQLSSLTCIRPCVIFFFSLKFYLVYFMLQIFVFFMSNVG